MKSYISTILHGSGISMVNLSEPGNKLIKPSHMMRLVHATKYNAAVMMFQAKWLQLHGMNMVTVD